MADVIAMAQTCPGCGSTVVNDDPTITHPLQFLDALRARGWYIPGTQPATSQQTRKPHACPKCAFSL